MQKLILSLALLALSSTSMGADSPKDVQSLIARGDYPGAETALREAVAGHPNSAKAHYVLAEVLAHEGNIGEAKAEASKAATLDPATKFTDPAKFQRFQHELDAALAPASNNRAAAATPRYVDTRQPAAVEGGPSHMTGILIVVGVLALIAFLWMRRRRNTDSQFGNYPPAPPTNGAPPYGTPPYGGYGNGNPGYGPSAPPSSGVGRTVAAGVGGLAAGVLLDEVLRSHREGEAPRDVGFSGDSNRDPSSQAYNDLRNDPIDMGNDDSSWGDSASGDSGSSDDDQW